MPSSFLFLLDVKDVNPLKGNPVFSRGLRELLKETRTPVLGSKGSRPYSLDVASSRLATIPRLLPLAMTCSACFTE